MTNPLETVRAANVLTIEDEPLIRETLSEMLSFGGHTVTLAGDGREGLRLFGDGDYDIVFTDLGLPGISGWDVAKTVKLSNSDVRVVMVTGWNVSIDSKEAVENGVDALLPKPFDMDHVLSLVQHLMESR